MVKVLVAYLIFINVIGFFSMGIDKWKSRKNRWRISEKTLFLMSFIGGSVGTLMGMYAFRHKTKHWYFKIGMPIILIIHIGVFIYFFFVRQ